MIRKSVHLFICPCVHPSIHESIHWPIHPSVHSSIPTFKKKTPGNAGIQWSPGLHWRLGCIGCLHSFDYLLPYLLLFLIVQHVLFCYTDSHFPQMLATFGICYVCCRYANTAIHSPIHPSVYLFVYPPAYPFIFSCTHHLYSSSLAIRSLTHPSTTPSVYVRLPISCFLLYSTAALPICLFRTSSWTLTTFGFHGWLSSPNSKSLVHPQSNCNLHRSVGGGTNLPRVRVV